MPGEPCQALGTYLLPPYPLSPPNALYQGFFTVGHRPCGMVIENHSLRVATGVLNEIMAEAVALNQPPSDKGKRLRLYYITQVSWHRCRVHRPGGRRRCRHRRRPAGGILRRSFPILRRSYPSCRGRCAGCRRRYGR